MAVNLAAGNRELVMLVDVLAREKNVPRDIVFGALEMALASATKKKYSDDIDVRVQVDKNTGAYDSFRRWKVVPDDAIETPQSQIALTEAQKRQPDVKVEDFVEEPLEPIEFGRIGAQTAKQVILQRIRDAEDERVLGDFRGREGRFRVSISVQRVQAQRFHELRRDPRLDGPPVPAPDTRPVGQRPLRRDPAGDLPDLRDAAREPSHHRRGEHRKARHARDHEHAAHDASHRELGGEVVREEQLAHAGDVGVGRAHDLVEARRTGFVGQQLDVLLGREPAMAPALGTDVERLLELLDVDAGLARPLREVLGGELLHAAVQLAAELP